jgi:general secretion pathway protein G
VIGKYENEAVTPGAETKECGMSNGRLPNLISRGFTLLELMIVISIIIILAAVALPQYQKSIKHAKESVLHDDLFKIRTLIDQYAADKGKLPGSLDELVSSGYMREIPKDPMTDQTDWSVTTGESRKAAPRSLISSGVDEVSE